MRKERLIVPVILGLTLLWALAQWIASRQFERELQQTLIDLEARGELVVERSEVQRGWLTSSGRIQLAPVLGDEWRLELTYQARHGVFNTRVQGELQPLHGTGQRALFGEVLPSTPPRWFARYQTLGGTLDGSVRLAPFIVQQGARELDFGGGHLTFGGQQGDWRLRLRLSPWRLSDGPVTLAARAATLESRYAYTAGAHHFTQHDLLRLEGLAWQQPELRLDAEELVYRSQMRLDDSELAIDGELLLGQVEAADQTLLTGQVALSLSRIHADALRAAMTRLRENAMQGRMPGTLRDLLADLEPQLIAALKDSPRLDVSILELDSPMLGLSVRASGALFFDARHLEELSLAGLDDPREQARWRSRLDGDFLWEEVPTVVALWLGLPLHTRELQIDVVRGQVRVNGRPLPPLWR